MDEQGRVHSGVNETARLIFVEWKTQKMVHKSHFLIKIDDFKDKYLNSVYLCLK